MANSNQLSKADNIKAANTEFCLYIQTADSYFYILIPGDKVMLFKETMSKTQVNLKEFGRVIAHGKGEPSASVKRTMEFTHGCNHDDAVNI